MGLVVLWLLILVPTVARRQQEVARLSPALLSGRVLERPMRHRYPEVGQMERPSTVGELVEARDDVPGPRGRDDDRHDSDDSYDTYDAEIDDDGRVHCLGDDLDGPVGDGDEGLGDGRDGGRAGDRERDPRSGRAAARYRPDRDAGPADTDLADDRFDDRGSDSGIDDEDADDARHDGGRDVRDLDELDRDDEHDADPDVDLDADLDERAGHDDLDHPEDADDLDASDHTDDLDADDPEQAPTRYRPGRGGFDPEAAAAAAHAKYAFRQRVVLALLVLLLAAGAVALLVSAVFWWVAGALGAGLVGYLTYLRRQVRIEESIRARRAARLTGARRRPEVEPEIEERPDTDPAHADHDDAGDADDETDWTADDGEPTRVRGTGEPLGVLPARRRTVDGTASTEHESSLPRLEVAPPPPVPDGTSLVDVDEEERPDTMDDLTPHRRAVGE
ncbi:putative CONSERVED TRANSMEMBRANE PROTEIN [Pseudonocardia sp. Ae168_Ps1]|nr:putative CONSERVED TRANSMEMBRANE PROTEIN [Pseudonocardia sp. Ae150A_Ps1]OLL81583.1 putative CONSERVED TRANSMEMBRANE PROTEIN [Pseudonocardia sp. Ae168_Ps1]OLL84304.1 putative CONSERVED TRANSMEMBRANE PROTEIN [Pseudonocardia sp. Ae263_Ps1]OLL95678.1 putative CONSERVED TRANSMEMBRANE PROTEIN [Pseudonocardia sp. Ae356_Ps1]